MSKEEKFVFSGRTKEDAIKKAEEELKKQRKFFAVNVIEETSNKTMFSILDKSNVTIEVFIDENKEKEILKKERNNKKRKLNEDSYKENVELVKEFLDKFKEQDLKLNFDYNIEELNPEIHINLDSEENSKLIGAHGKTLNAFEIYLNQMLYTKFKPAARIYLNVGDYKERRIANLENLAHNAAQTVIKTRDSLSLEPMNAFDRKIVHNSLQENPEVKTESVGTEPNRKVVISLNK